MSIAAMPFAAAARQHLGPGVPRDVTVAPAVEAARRAAERRDEVFGAPHQRRDVREGRDLRGGQHAACRLAERDHLELREVDEVGRAIALGEHHRAVPGLAERLEIGGEVGGRGWVDAHDHALGVERRRDERGARRLLRVVGDGVLEVEDHGVGALECLRVAVGAVGRAEEQCGPESEGRMRHPLVSSSPAAGAAACSSPAAWNHTSTERVARATSTPCWLRPTCRSVTTP